MPLFRRHIGVDYSGATTPTASLKGLRVYLVEDEAPLAEVLPLAPAGKYWSRMGIAEWLVRLYFPRLLPKICHRPKARTAEIRA
jgi:hypothetical protein